MSVALLIGWLLGAAASTVCPTPSEISGIPNAAKNECEEPDGMRTVNLNEVPGEVVLIYFGNMF